MERFSIYYDNYCVAIYKRDDKEKEYSYYGGYPSVHEGEIPDQYLTVYKEKTPFRPIEELMNEENRVAGYERRKPCCRNEKAYLSARAYQNCKGSPGY